MIFRPAWVKTDSSESDDSICAKKPPFSSPLYISVTKALAAASSCQTLSPDIWFSGVRSRKSLLQEVSKQEVPAMIKNIYLIVRFISLGFFSVKTRHLYHR